MSAGLLSGESGRVCGRRTEAKVSAQDRGLRVLFSSYTPEWTGPAKSLVQLLEHLGAHLEPWVLVPGAGPLVDTLSSRSLPVFSLPALDKWSILSQARLIERENIDIVYGNTIHGSSRNSAIAAWLAGVPFVCHVREMGWDLGWKTLWYLRFVDAVIAVSHACAASVARFVPEGRLHVVHNGVPLSRGEAHRGVGTDLRAELGVSPDALVILSLAHLSPRKGQMYALRAMSRLLGRWPNAHLCLAGRPGTFPDYDRKLQDFVTSRRIEDHVHFLGFRRDVSRLTAQSDVFLHTAVADPHPRAVLEAMKAGLPVVAFEVDGVAETVLDGETGRLVAPGDDEDLATAIADLAESREARERLGAAGRRRIESHFSSARTAERVLDILESVGAPRR